MVRPGEWPPGFGRGPAERDALLVLSHLGSVPPRDLHALAWRCRSARGCVAAVAAGQIGSPADRAMSAALDTAVVRAALERCDARLVAPGDDEYAESLLDLRDPPAAVFVRGGPLPSETLASGRPRAVAVVGARRSTAYGRDAARAIGAGLAAAGVTVVSGAARGIDAAAHRGALDAGGPTVAVLGSGIDRPYPPANHGLIEEIAAEGTVVSEYPPGTRALPHRFPARNRIVAALASAIVVVEGESGSGSLITVDHGVDLGREVLAVPGPITSPLTTAPHELIRDGAGLVRGPGDVLAALGLEPETTAVERPDPSRGDRHAGLSAEERAVLGQLGAPTTAERVATASGLGVARAVALLAALELRGLVRAVGGRYERVTRPERTPRSLGKEKSEGGAKMPL